MGSCQYRLARGDNRGGGGGGGQTYFAEKTEDLKTAVVDAEGGRAGEAVETAADGRQHIVKNLRHDKRYQNWV